MTREAMLTGQSYNIVSRWTVTNRKPGSHENWDLGINEKSQSY